MTKTIDALVEALEFFVERFKPNKANYLFSQRLALDKAESALAQARAEQVEPVAVAFLDIGAGGYVDLGSDLTDGQLAELPLGRHALAIVGTFGVDGYAPTTPPAAPVASAEQAEPQPVASELAQTAPECIWLQVNPDAVADSGLPFPDEHDNVTWCDESIGGEEVKYVRADLATPPAPVQAVEPLTAWQPQFEAISHKQETLVREFCAEIAGPFGGVGNPPDPVRLLEMAQALYEAERDDLAAAPPLPKGGV